MPNRPERETSLLKLCYSHAAKLVVAEFQRREATRSVSSIYVRDGVTREYQRLAPPDDALSYQHPFPVRSEPFVYFNVMKVSERGGGAWLHIARANLVTREVEVVLSMKELDATMNVDRSWRIGSWVSDLQSVSDDGTTITCLLGVPEPQGGGSFHMNYSLFDFDVRDRTMTLLARLDTPFL
jgi:hypothetical protein